MVHEFAHFIHPNHSKHFWAFVESMMPDYRSEKPCSGLWNILIFLICVVV
ncbi:MAG: M48 family metallopeptidase [Clostridia bacterium]